MVLLLLKQLAAAKLLVSERPARSPSIDSLLMSDLLVVCPCGPNQGHILYTKQHLELY